MIGDDRPRILVVDDDLTIRGFLADALADEGYDVKVAQHGRDAFTVLGEWRADLILLDLMMPVMDGWDFRARQMETPDLAAIPVIAMSAAHGMRGRIESLDLAGALPKPFEMERMLDVVREVLPLPGLPPTDPHAPGQGAETSNGVSAAK